MIYIASLIVPFIINFSLIPLLIHIAHSNDWYDQVNQRKIHSGDMPRIGGVGIFLSTLIGGIVVTLLYGHEASSFFSNLRLYAPLFASVFIIHIIGLLDDFANLRARYKLIAQILIGVVIVFSGRQFETLAIPFFDVSFDLGFAGPLLTLFWVVGITNAINLIDGLDGLSSGVSAIGFFFLGLIALALDYPFGAVVGFLVFGSSLAFLYYNYPPARIFMGDSGSLYLGVMAAVLPFYTLQPAKSNGYLLLLAATIFIIPIFDTLAAILRRRRKGLAFYMPDQEHLHHKLLAFGLSNKAILAVVYGITILASLSVYWWVLSAKILAMGAILLVWIATLLFFLVLHYKRRT